MSSDKRMLYVLADSITLLNVAAGDLILESVC